MKMGLIFCESTLLAEIGDPGFRRRDIGVTYGMALRSSEAGEIDWAKVNAAIIGRWSMAGLRWIKRFAHTRSE